MPASDIVVKGAREHNLQSVDLVLPRNRLICLTGVSGSGKSSLAFDTLYAEGQRRYIESLSTFARQFVGQLPKPDVDLISGLSPSISISQKSSGTNPRSTVGTITEIYDFLRVLYARVGQGHCPRCDRPITAQSREQIMAHVMRLPAGTRFQVLAPLVVGQKGQHRDLFADLLRQGYARARVDGQLISLSDPPALDGRLRHDVEVVVDRLAIKPDVRPRLAEAVDLAMKLGKGSLVIHVADEPDEQARAGEASAAETGDTLFSLDYACTRCGISFPPPSPQLFSFNSPQGMCPDCDGLGELYSFDPELLIPAPSLPLRDGAFEFYGKWKDLGRWRRHIWQGVAETMERHLELDQGTLLETPWEQLGPELQRLWLWGTGDTHITYTWRGGAAPDKYGGKFEGLIPELRAKYRNSKSRMHQRQLERYMNTVRCGTCEGERLVAQARCVRLTSASPQFASPLSLPQVCGLSVESAAEFFSELVLSETQRLIAEEALKEIRNRLGFLNNVGLGYLALDRTAPTLSGGESQRIRLAAQIGSGLVGVLYILDEPSIGLHPRDNDQLLATLERLRDLGNTVVVVEHDEDTMRAADQLIDFGPGPGVRGGEVVAVGTAREVAAEPRSVTGQYLSGERQIAIPARRRGDDAGTLVIEGAAHNNLQHVDVPIPLGRFVCVTGVSGSGKSSLVNDILVEALRRDLNRGQGAPGKHRRLVGVELLDKMIAIDQSPIGRTPRSNPGTYIKVFDDIRNLFCQLPEAKRRGYKPGRFSFNVKGGRCEACEGNGSNKLEMDFLADIWVTCPVCEGHRFSRETLQVKFKGHSIAEVLEMDLQQALELFENIPNVRHKLQTLHDVGLDYLKLGQPSPTLSGGEAQRIKLAKELVKKSTGRTLYLLDEPTTGLHFADIELLLQVLHGFVDAGNTVVVVEHNLDVIKTADWVLDMGPEGGGGGGRLIASGTPEDVAACPESYTGRALARILPGVPRPKRRAGGKPKPRRRTVQEAKKVVVRGACQHNLKLVDAEIPRDQMTVFCGPSGSGKTSLAMDTIYAEGQRRYVESLSAYARQFIGQMQKPRLDQIEGLSPAIAIEQKNLGHTPRSTVGTVTEIYDYLRILMARLGTPYCPDCDQPIGTQSVDEIVDKVLALEEGSRVLLTAPLEVNVGQHYEYLWEEMRSRGYVRVRIDGQTYSLDGLPTMDRRRRYSVEAVVDRLVVRAAARARIAESVEQALALGKGVLQLVLASETLEEHRWPVAVHSQHLACHACGRSFERLSPHSFSFNSRLGWCSACEGLGTQTGANPKALLRDGKRTLADGAVGLWPDLSQAMARRMLQALAADQAIPLDVPFEQLSGRHRRLILHGTGDRWYSVSDETSGRALFRFQFKGLYPALEEASRLSPALRNRLEHLVDEVECSSCSGCRLRDDASAVRFQGRTIDEWARLPLGELATAIQGWTLSDRELRIAGELLREIRGRVGFLNDVGLHYLSLSRGAATLSNGEAQRIRLASQLGSGLCGVLYVLDEPTIGLHPRDNTRLLQALHKLRDLGNTLLIVEHDREVIEGSDQICDFGPGAGSLGGQIVARGTPRQLARKRNSVTGPYLSGRKAIPIPATRRSQPPGGEWLSVLGARHNNLKQVDIDIPLGTLTAVTGPSGSGKSSLVEDVLYAALARKLHRASTIAGSHDGLRGLEHINKVIQVTQQPLGNSPSSNPATYTGVFELIRVLFSHLPEAKLRGYSARRFSFNVAGGRCEDCEGNGQKCVEMHFLPDVWVECPTCQGQRYNPETLAVRYKEHTISDVLNLTCGQALELFHNIPKVRRIVQTLCDVGLDYLTLGQPAPTLSGGEAQRVKLAAELSRPDTGRTLYLLDEPTTGLHFDDLAKLLDVLQRLVELGNTVLVIEHNLDVIKCADWVIDMGPEAGEAGGQVVVQGTPEQVVQHAREGLTPISHTGEVLKPVLEAGPYGPRLAPGGGKAEKPSVEGPPDVGTEGTPEEEELDITEVGRDAPMPWEVDGRKWHTQDRVDRRGEPCRWDGRILARVVDQIHELGSFSPTDWNSRSVVEIAAETKSHGWFLHAITGETWLLKLKLRAAAQTFVLGELQRGLNLKTLNELESLPIYGNESRVRLKNHQGSWQEVEIRAYSLEELDTPWFWDFLKRAVTSFQEAAEQRAASPEDVMPWKVLGRKWHFLRKGFPPGKRVSWDTELLEQLVERLGDIAEGGQFLWNNKQLVHLLHPDGQAWATVLTKKPQHVVLCLNGPKGGVSLGRVAGLGRRQEVDQSHSDRDVVKLFLRSMAELESPALQEFLAEHWQQRG